MIRSTIGPGDVSALVGQLDEDLVVHERDDPVALADEPPQPQLGPVGGQALERRVPALRVADPAPDPARQRDDRVPEEPVAEPLARLAPFQEAP